MADVIENRNFLLHDKFNFQIARLPSVNFFVQDVVLPGVSIPDADTPSPLTKINNAGDHLIFEPLIVQFKIDEDMRNWYEIFNWMQGIGFPENFNQYADLKEFGIKDIEGEEVTKKQIRKTRKLK
jgi:hypothetical protein